MERSHIQSISSGLSQRGVRDHNERLLLSLIQRHGGMPASDLAKQANLSAPTVSTILRRLEADGLVRRGEPIRGKVGKPSVPMHLDPDGALSFGLKIGRTSAEFVLVDFVGNIRHESQFAYQAPLPEKIFEFVSHANSDIVKRLPPELVDKICGLGVATPFEMWNRPENPKLAAPIFSPWWQVDVRAELNSLTGYAVSVINDATAACHSEHTFGRGREFRDYAYFFVGNRVGGGIVLDNSVFEGRLGNAGALGSLESIGPNGESMQLVDTASIHLLEQRLSEDDLDPSRLWTEQESWKKLARHVDPWLGQTAQQLAKAALSTCSVIDFEAVVIDGAFPDFVRKELVGRVERYVSTQDMRGLIKPRIEAGSVGGIARAKGAATQPLRAQFLLNTQMSTLLAV